MTMENPVYNRHGFLLGYTKEGMAGEIIICTAPGKYKFSDYTANQLLNEKDVFTMDDCLSNGISDPNRITTKVLWKILQIVLFITSGLDILC